jgi:molybdopterin-guanine dinucleotide biosynthesis protein A
MGRDKALIEMDGESLLERKVQKGKAYFDEVILLSGQTIYSMENRWLPDKIENAGPLAGLLEALKDGAEHSKSHIVIIPVDLPFLSESTLKKLSTMQNLETNDAIILRSGDDLQPLAGIYSTDLADNLALYLRTGNRMVFGFINQLIYSTITVNDLELKNVNSPDDLKN